MVIQEQDAMPACIAGLGKRLPRGKPLPPYAVEYFNQLVAHYLSLGLADTDPALSLNRNAQRVADAIIREQDKNRLNWGDLSGLEMAVLQLLPEPNLQRLAWSLRARYAEIAGPAWSDLYEQSCPPPVSASSAPAMSLRADLTVLLSELQRLRAVTQVREEQRARITFRAALGAFGLMTLAILLFFLFPNRPGGPNHPSPPGTLPHDWQIICFVIATGAIGGLISMLRRIQAASGAGIAQVDTIALGAGEVGVTLSPLYGAVFALVLYFVFMGSLLDAKLDGMSLFPALDPKSGLMSAYGDFAKLLVWSFIAGFAEKFVPDVLDRLTARNQAVKQVAVK